MKRWLRSLGEILYLRLTRYMGDRGLILFGKSDPPPPPDYKSAAEETAAGNKEALIQQTWANRPDQVTPWGTSTWDSSSAVDPSTGQPVTKWTQKQDVSPELQGALSNQLGLQDKRTQLATDQMNRVSQGFEQPFDWSNLPEASTPQVQTQGWNEEQFGKQRDDYTQAAWSRMQPEHTRQEEALRTRLANQGLTQGSEAFNNEMNRLQGAQATEKWNALNSGSDQQARLNQMMLANQGQAFGQQQQLSTLQNLQRQQAIAEQSQKRHMSLNEMNALLTGQQVNPAAMPSFNTAGSMGGTNYMGAAQAQGNADLAAWQSKVGQEQATNAGIGSLAAIAAYAAMSDRRLKSKIRRIGTHPLGIGIYKYEIWGVPEIGVMAQELLEVAPELVVKTPSGYLAVNYERL